MSLPRKILLKKMFSLLIFIFFFSPYFSENYQRSATAGKFLYIMLILKSILYGIFVMGMMLRSKVRNRVLLLYAFVLIHSTGDPSGQNKVIQLIFIQTHLS